MKTFTIVSFAFFILRPFDLSAQPIDLNEVLKLAESSSPNLKQKHFLESAAEERVGIDEAGYKPRVDLQAIDSYGFPGTTGVLGAGGIMGSSYRSGWAAGLVIQQTLVDFGETKNRVDAAEREVLVKKLESRLEKQNVKILAMKAFYDCARLRSQRELNDTLMKQTRMITQEVKSFVKTGQRSIIDSYLAQAQVEELETARDEYDGRLLEAQQSLGMLLGVSSVTCPPLPTNSPWVSTNPIADSHPYVEVVKTEAKAEESRREMVKKQLLPKISGMVTVGDMEKARLVPKKDYAVGVAITMPLFDGSIRDHEISRSDALIASYAAQADARKLELTRNDLSLAGEKEAAATRYEHAQKRIKESKKAFKLARERYSSSGGSLVDLRDAAGLVAHDETVLIDSRAKVLIASGIQAFMREAADGAIMK